jgi:hypothetical protein
MVAKPDTRFKADRPVPKTTCDKPTHVRRPTEAGVKNWDEMTGEEQQDFQLREIRRDPSHRQGENGEG